MSYSKKVLSATFFNFVSKVLVTCLGMFSTLILARLLTPNDFGLVATASLVTSFFELLSRLGTEQYLIKTQDLDDDDINTAWTFQLITKILISLLIFSFSTNAASFFNEPELEDVLKVLSLIPLIIGLSNIGIILAKKSMEFKEIMKLEVIVKIFSFIATVVLAFLIKNYWAFVFGNLVNFIAYSVLTYKFFSYRPRFSLSCLSKQISFSQWTFLKGIVNYTSGKVDQIFITKFLGVIELGAFSVSQRIAEIPRVLFLFPIKDSVFPALGQLVNDKEEFKEKVHKTLFISIFISLPISMLLILSASSLVELLLGSADKWHLATMILPYFSLLIVILNFNDFSFGVLTLLGEVKCLFKIEIFSTLISIVTYFLGLKFYGLIGVVVAKLLVDTMVSFILLFVLKSSIGFSIRRLIVSYIPVVACNLMAFLLCLYIRNNVSLSHFDFFNVVFISFVYVIALIFLVIVVMLIYNNDGDWKIIKNTCYSLTSIFIGKISKVKVQ
ncbi:MAG: lipopolysaccharide biosynthesis protein [Vibrio sp.]|uniref:lipopolysaccharide biosynthesis protein n=1 Tax=Vibrio sp. TaxID=678 RepID=UPI003A8C0E22